jgi:Ca2+-binding RTX toxin-like protein
VHIHNAAQGANGGIVLDWPSGGDADDFAVSAVLADGSRTLTSNWETTDVQPITPFAATFAAAMLGADVPFYVNIHTGANPGGEIRGQLVAIATDNGETVNGTGGNDILPGLGGDDAINGGAGNDSLDGGTGADTMTGGSGNDTYFVDNAGDAVIESAGNGTDTVNTMVSYGLTAEVENLVLQGGADLQGYGNTLSNMITGNAGGNLLDGGVGADTMTGGAGGDTYFVDDAGDTVVENVGEGSDAVFSTVHYALTANVETLVLQGSADLQGYGNSLNNAIFGNAGTNLLNGFAGADVMYGGAGGDVYFVDDTGDAAIENVGEGNDTVFSTVNYGIAANVENLILLGAADLQGFGNGLGNVIYGNTGNNLLDGGAGVDLMVGGTGDDIYFVDDTSDSAFEVAGQGNDAVFASAHYGLAADVETLILQGSADFQGYGSNQVNTLYGNTGNNLLNGAAGADTMYGGVGNDTYFVDNAMDAVVENLGEGTDAVFASVNYTLTANVEALVLNGPGNLSGTGNALANSLFGNAGNNALDGGAGVDVLQGNAGNDTFVFNMGQGNGDTVVDFAGNGAAAGDSLQFVGFGVGATFTNIDATHWEVNHNGGASHDVITFLNGASVDATDFVFM